MIANRTAVATGKAYLLFSGLTPVTADPGYRKTACRFCFFRD